MWRRLVTREEGLFTIVSAEHPGSTLLSGGYTRASWIHGCVYPVFRDAEESVTIDMIRGKNKAYTFYWNDTRTIGREARQVTGLTPAGLTPPRTLGGGGVVWMRWIALTRRTGRRYSRESFEF